MDKSLGTLYHKLTNLFHTNSSSSSSSNASSVPETGTSLPISTFFDRLIPSTTSATTSHNNNDQRRSSARVSHQISIKTNDKLLPPYIQKTTPVNITKQKR
jgi:hypothetical protein